MRVTWLKITSGSAILVSLAQIGPKQFADSVASVSWCERHTLRIVSVEWSILHSLHTPPKSINPSRIFPTTLIDFKSSSNPSLLSHWRLPESSCSSPLWPSQGFALKLSF